MASVNKVILVGNLGRDPDARFSSQGGNTVSNISLATTRRWRDAQGTAHEEPEWHRVCAFGKTAEIINKYCKKGDQVYVCGRLQTRKYTGRDGTERSVTEVVCEDIQLLSNRGQPPEQAAPQPARNRGSGTRVEDEDIPF